jgi:hypothetical protein
MVNVVAERGDLNRQNIQRGQHGAPRGLGHDHHADVHHHNPMFKIVVRVRVVISLDHREKILQFWQGNAVPFQAVLSPEHRDNGFQNLSVPRLRRLPSPKAGSRGRLLFFLSIKAKRFL